MKNSGLSVPAASLNNGFSTSRPTTAITAMAIAASTRAMTTPWATEVAVGGAAQCADQEQERHHGEVLGEQDGEAGAAGGRHHAALARQHFHDEGGRGERQAGADDQRRRRRLAEPQGAEADHHRREQALQAAQPEHQAAHGEQAPHRQFEADEEQQEDDAQVGDEGDLLLAGDGEPVDGPRIVGQTAQAMRSQRGADGEETQDGTDFQAVDHRGDDGRGAQDDEGILEDEDLAASRHCRQHRLRWPICAHFRFAASHWDKGMETT